MEIGIWLHRFSDVDREYERLTTLLAYNTEFQRIKTLVNNQSVYKAALP